MTNPTLEEMVQELYDKQKIREVAIRYARGVDRMDRELLMSAYHPDAIDDHGFFVGNREDFWTWVNTYHVTNQSTHQHIIGNHYCEIDGDVAHTETYWLFAALDKNGANLSIGGGRYIDRMEKRDGEWRIAARKCVPDWGGVPTTGQSNPEQSRMLRESGIVARDKTDSSYERPLSIPKERVGINVMF
ncbi:MAG: nuclear transport factor 2 family protein [Sphingomonadaceae bacterium]|nr:nuclear transport factor 2 family protein [Sphingomonadaceae bacterium]